jgi:hypothetical protein
MLDAQRNDTPWEQGFVLSAASVEKLRLGGSTPSDTVAILISHDCDVIESAATEPDCELIIGRKIDSINGLFANGKNPRRLHLNFSAGKTPLSVELLATGKRTIAKDLLLAEEPLEDVRLTPDEHFTLQAWLAARYHRPIFPDEFDRRLKEKPAEVHKKLANVIKGGGTDIVAVLFDIDAGKNETHEGPDDPYSLSIFVVYDVSDDPGRAEATAKRAASLIKSIFRQYFFADKKWKNIELRECLPVSADAISVHQLRSLKPWNFDYLEIVQ